MCFIHNNGKSNLGKFDPRSDNSIFLGALSSKTSRVFNKKMLSSKKFVHVVFDDINPRVHEVEAVTMELLLPIQRKVHQSSTLKLILKSHYCRGGVDYPSRQSQYFKRMETTSVTLRTPFSGNLMTKSRYDLPSENKLLWLLYLKWNPSE